MVTKESISIRKLDGEPIHWYRVLFQTREKRNRSEIREEEKKLAIVQRDHLSH